MLKWIVSQPRLCLGGYIVHFMDHSVNHKGDSLMIILLQLFALSAALWAAIGVLTQGYGE